MGEIRVAGYYYTAASNTFIKIEECSPPPNIGGWTAYAGRAQVIREHLHYRIPVGLRHDIPVVVSLREQWVRFWVDDLHPITFRISEMKPEQVVDEFVWRVVREAWDAAGG